LNAATRGQMESEVARTKRPHDHPAYDDTRRKAVNLAAAGVAVAMYWNDRGVFLLPASNESPHGSTLVCIAQRWDARTVQLRFSKAQSEWVPV